VLQTSKLTAKYQATVPTSIRKALNLNAGDLISFEIVGNEVKISRVSPLDVAFSQALEGTLEEWSSEKDDLAFRDL
jgi:antitoxin PrlF